MRSITLGFLGLVSSLTWAASVAAHVPTLLLDQVHPIHEVVLIDYFIPGCPPSGDAIYKFLTDLIAGRTPRLDRERLHYD